MDRQAISSNTKLCQLGMKIIQWLSYVVGSTCDSTVSTDCRHVSNILRRLVSLTGFRGSCASRRLSLIDQQMVSVVDFLYVGFVCVFVRSVGYNTSKCETREHTLHYSFLQLYMLSSIACSIWLHLQGNCSQFTVVLLTNSISYPQKLCSNVISILKPYIIIITLFTKQKSYWIVAVQITNKQKDNKKNNVLYNYI